jgi:MoaA/NifB/PqqE/SkfB family radical SAM enzyme
MIWLGLTGGEPFVRKDLADIVQSGLEECKALHTVSVPTSGFSPIKIKKEVEKILQLDIPSLYISIALDGPKDVHDKIRGVRDSFERAVETFALLSKINEPRLKYHFEYTISKFNQGMLEDTILNSGHTPNDFIITLGANAPFYNNTGLDVVASEEVIKNEINWFLSQTKIRSVHDSITKIFLRAILRNQSIPCYAGNKSFFVGNDGKVMNCTFKKERPIGFCNCFSPCESYFSLLMNLRKLRINRLL